jgi:predicted aconitase
MATNCITATHAAAIINPCSHAAMQLRNKQLEFMQQRESSQATNQVVVATEMGVQSQQRMGAVKKCKKMGTKRLTKHALRQHPIDAGGVAFIAIENCAICRAKHLCARGINTGIPKRAHHKACPKNYKN